MGSVAIDADVHSPVWAGRSSAFTVLVIKALLTPVWRHGGFVGLLASALTSFARLVRRLGRRTSLALARLLDPGATWLALRGRKQRRRSRAGRRGLRRRLPSAPGSDNARLLARRSYETALEEAVIFLCAPECLAQRKARHVVKEFHRALAKSILVFEDELPRRRDRLAVGPIPVGGFRVLRGEQPLHMACPDVGVVTS